MAPRDAYLLAGATASGKSAVAALLAREMGAAILNADSMLVYKGMDIGTAKPSPAERAEFRMGGIDLVTPAEEFSAGAWLRAAAAWAATIPAETPIVIVGGTGLYFSALLRGLDRAWTKPPPEYPVLQIDRAVVRARIAARLDDMFLSGLEREKTELHRLYPTWSRTAATTARRSTCAPASSRNGRTPGSGTRRRRSTSPSARRPRRPPIVSAPSGAPAAPGPWRSEGLRAARDFGIFVP